MPTDELREILVSLPGAPADIYRRHQLVWRAMHNCTRPGSRFLFAAVSPHLVRVRGAIDRGRPAVLSDGDIRVDLVVASRHGNSMRALEDSELPGWTRRLMQVHGYAVTDVTTLARGEALGRKLDKSTGQTLEIRLPVASLHLKTRIENRARADLAWSHGIGRGRRFGYGMMFRAG